MSAPVDVQAVMDRQRSQRQAMRIIPSAPRKPRKTITQRDVDAAVAHVLGGLDLEFRRLGVEFPKYRAAYDTARVAVQNARRKP